MRNTRNLFLSAAVTATLSLSSATVRADQPDKYTKPHEPFTANGMQVRMSIINPINNSDQSVLTPTVFQEIAPCRLTSTLAVETYASQWGGPSYQANESRRYAGRGYLSAENFTNPCSEAVPNNAIGLVGRFTVTSAAGDGEIHVDATNASSSHAATVLKFHKGQTLMFEAGVMFAPDGSFDVATWYAGADVQIDVLGYLMNDPAPTGGPKGDKGDKGDTGAVGAKGDKGDNGSVGAKGDKGDNGATGANGAEGDKGDTGAVGPQGAKGDTGAIGPQGARGENGAIGPQGVKGDTGAGGPQGVRGDTGAIGPQGPKGDTGAVGAKGDKGDKGENGVAGPQGPTGPAGLQGATGPQGPQGLIGPVGPHGPQGNPGRDGRNGMTAIKGGACYPPGTNANSVVSVRDASVTANSIVMLNYTDDNSKGQAQALVSQGEGHFETTGSPNTCFQYVVINASAP